MNIETERYGMNVKKIIWHWTGGFIKLEYVNTKLHSNYGLVNC